MSEPANSSMNTVSESATVIEKPRSLGRDAWDDLRRNPLVILSAALIAVFVVMAIAPGLFTTQDPKQAGFCDLRLSRQGPRADAWFGRNLQGCDVYTLTIYGARASILVGVLAALTVAIVGTAFGLLSGYFGGVVDTAISRMTDIFFGIPFLLGAILVLTSFPSGGADSFWAPVLKVVLALSILGWPGLTRVMRSSVLQTRSADYVAAARALGAPTSRILRTHVLPNSIQPVIVYATILLGAFIGAEASLSFLGVGLQPPAISWGIAISDAQNLVQASPHMLMFPALFLSLTVLAFIMLGDAVRDALDPKQR